MSNMYGYSDYDGPRVHFSDEHSKDETEPQSGSSSSAIMRKDVTEGDDVVVDDDDEDMNPLQVGFWMDGDSMAPPCGTSVPTIHKILEMAELCPDDVLYDLGCGDGRVCLETWHLYQCQTIGIEVEADLVERAQTLISRQLSNTDTPETNLRTLPRVYQMDLRQALDLLLKRAMNDVGQQQAAPHSHTDWSGGDEVLDLPLPTVLVLYLLPEALAEIEPQLSKLLHYTPNCRIVCNTWGFKTWKAVKETVVQEETAAGVSTAVFVYTQKSLQNP